MRITRSSVAKFAQVNGLEPIQLDGIPEGFSFIEPDINIGGKDYSGMLVAFVPLCNWEDGMIRTHDMRELLEKYFKILKTHNA